MALEKEYLLDCGIIANYWRITNFYISPKDKEAVIGVELYINKEIRDKNHTPIPETHILYEIKNNQEEVDNIIELKFQTPSIIIGYDEFINTIIKTDSNLMRSLYTLLKQKINFFADAKDV